MVSNMSDNLSCLRCGYNILWKVATLVLELTVLDGLGLLLGLLGSWCSSGGIGLSCRGLGGSVLCCLGGYK